MGFDILRSNSIRAAHRKELVHLLAGQGIDKLEELGVAAKGVDVDAVGCRSVLKELDIANQGNKGNDLDAGAVVVRALMLVSCSFGGSNLGIMAGL